jgi:hypothetical protein
VRWAIKKLDKRHEELLRFIYFLSASENERGYKKIPVLYVSDV